MAETKKRRRGKNCCGCIPRLNEKILNENVNHKNKFHDFIKILGQVVLQVNQSSFFLLPRSWMDKTGLGLFRRFFEELRTLWRRRRATWRIAKFFEVQAIFFGVLAFYSHIVNIVLIGRVTKFGDAACLVLNSSCS